VSFEQVCMVAHDMPQPLPVPARRVALQSVKSVIKEEEKMFDAEIATILLNRWSRYVADDEGDWYLDMLREGNLAFIRERGHVGRYGSGDINACLAESLYFGDGSRALRITSARGVGVWTEWTALQPPRQSDLQ
jgi:hypothetical protein